MSRPTNNPHDDGHYRRARSVLVVRVTAVVIIAFAGPVACSNGSSTPASTTPSPSASAGSVSNTAELCAAAAEFQTAANNITQLNALQGGVSGVKAALQNLQSAGTNLAAAAKDEFGPEVTSLTNALTSLKTTVASLSDQSSLSSQLGALTTSAAGVERAAAAIVDSVKQACPAASLNASSSAQVPSTS